MKSKHHNICSVCGHDETGCSTEEVERRSVEHIVFKKLASAAILQRDLKISYEKAALTLNKLEMAGLIGQADGAKPRKIYKRKLKGWVKAHSSKSQKSIIDKIITFLTPS